MKYFGNKSSITRKCWDVIRPFLYPGMLTLETGSGLSTILIEAVGCNHLALEHDPEYAPDSPCVKIAPIVNGWYDWRPEHKYEFILIDGPTRNIGRSGILKVMPKLLKPDTIIVQDDVGHDDKDKKLMRHICRKFNFHPYIYSHNGGWEFAVLRPS